MFTSNYPLYFNAKSSEWKGKFIWAQRGEFRWVSTVTHIKLQSTVGWALMYKKRTEQFKAKSTMVRSTAGQPLRNPWFRHQWPLLRDDPFGTKTRKIRSPQPFPATCLIPLTNSSGESSAIALLVISSIASILWKSSIAVFKLFTLLDVAFLPNPRSLLSIPNRPIPQPAWPCACHPTP